QEARNWQSCSSPAFRSPMYQRSAVLRVAHLRDKDDDRPRWSRARLTERSWNQRAWSTSWSSPHPPALSALARSGAVAPVYAKTLTKCRLESAMNSILANCKNPVCHNYYYCIQPSRKRHSVGLPRSLSERPTETQRRAQTRRMDLC